MKRAKRWLMATSAIGLSLIVAVPVAQAQETPAAQDKSVVLGTILIRSDADGTVSGNAISVDGTTVNTVSGGDLDTALRSVAGVFTNNQVYRPGVAVNVRGFEGQGRVNMMIDGVKQTYRNAGHEASGYTYVDPALLSEIDITRGSSTGVGGGSLAGSTNMRTLGIDDVVRAGQRTGGMVRLGFGDNGAGTSAMVAAGIRGDILSMVGALSMHDSKNYENGDGISQPNTGQEIKSGLLKAEWQIDPSQKLSLGAVVYDSDYMTSYRATADKVNLTNQTFTLGYRYTPGDDLVDLSVNAYLNDTKSRYDDNGREIRDRGRGFDVSNVSHFDLGGVQVRSANGIEYFADKASTRNDTVNPNNGKSETSAIFSDNSFTLGAVDVTIGLRYDHYKLSGSTRGDATGAGAYKVDNSKGFFSPKVTLALNTMEGFTPYLTWSRSMRAPSLIETMVGGDHGFASSGFLPNPDLKPETQKGLEIGATFTRDNLIVSGDTFSGRISYFNMDVENYITGAVVPRVGFTHVNHPGTSEISGLELEASYDAGKWFGSLSYTMSDSDLPPQLNGFGATQYPPDDTLSLMAGVRLMDEALTIGARYNYVSGGNDIDWANPRLGDLNPIKVYNDNSYETVDLFSTYKVNENFEVNLQVSNLFDKAYTPFLGTTESPAYGHIGRGRTVELSGQMRF